MIFRKQRAAVKSATRAIRDLVLRPGRELASGGSLGGRRLQQRAEHAVAAGLRAAATGARDGGPAARRAARAGRTPDGHPRRAAPRAGAGVRGAGAGGQRRRRGRARALPEPAGRGDGRPDGGAGPPRLPHRAAPADARRGPHLQPLRARRPLPAGHGRGPLSVRRPGRTELRNFSLLGDEAGCEHPERLADVHRQPVPPGPDRDPADAGRRRHADVQAAGGEPRRPGRDRPHRSRIRRRPSRTPAKEADDG